MDVVEQHNTEIQHMAPKLGLQILYNKQDIAFMQLFVNKSERNNIDRQLRTYPS